MSVFIDQLGRTINLHSAPKRIVSLVPSQTELLHYLGLTTEVVGITRFCIHPAEWFNSKKRVGGTKDFDLARINALQPDLIIANKEENVQDKIDALAQQYPVWVSNINTLTDAYNMIQQVGTMIGKTKNAAQLVEQLQTQFAQINKQSLSVAYLIWRNPYMAAGGNTFINHLLTNICGFNNIFAPNLRYPTVTLEQLAQASPNYVFLSSEPYPFKEKHIAELKTALPNTTIQLVDGELFSWYGSRLLHTAHYLQSFLAT